MHKNGIQSYRKTNVITSDPKKLVLMCYEGAIDNLKIAKQGIIKKAYEEKGNALAKAQDIINELMNSLDFERGGSIATSLDSLYGYMIRRIIHASIADDINAIEEVIGMLSELKSAWEEIFYKEDKMTVQPEATVFEAESGQQGLNYANL